MFRTRGRRASRAAAAWIDRELIAAERDPTLVGSSLDGFYATYLAERFGARGALINPAIRPYDDLRRHAGAQLNLHTGEAFEVTEAHFARFRFAGCAAAAA